jgi:hypothetical protein
MSRTSAGEDEAGRFNVPMGRRSPSGSTAAGRRLS